MRLLITNVQDVTTRQLTEVNGSLSPDPSSPIDQSPFYSNQSLLLSLSFSLCLFISFFLYPPLSVSLCFYLSLSQSLSLCLSPPSHCLSVSLSVCLSLSSLHLIRCTQSLNIIVSNTINKPLLSMLHYHTQQILSQHIIQHTSKTEDSSSAAPTLFYGFISIGIISLNVTYALTQAHAISHANNFLKRISTWGKLLINY